MESRTFATIGIVIAIIVALVFLRNLFIRRARTSLALDPRESRRSSNVVIMSGGDWRDGGVGGIGFGPHYTARTTVTRPDTAATGGRQRGGDLGETTEQLPKYEAAPPGYDTLYKDGHPVAQDTELSNNGESSTAAAAAGGRGSGEVAINMEPAHQASSQAQPPPPFSSENPGAPPRQ